MKQTKQMSETHLLAILLAVVGGFLDAYTYICRGHVFANAQTGNIVLLGLHLTNQDWKRPFIILFPYWRLYWEFLSVKPFRPFLNGKKPYTGGSLWYCWN